MGYSYSMKNDTNELNIKNDGNNTSANSMRNAGTAAAPRPGHRLAKCKMLLWLALPLTLAAGCASNPNRAVVDDKFFTDDPALVATPVSQSEAANRVPEREIINVFMADTSTSQSMGVSVNAGVATVIMWPTAREWKDGSSFDVVERQLIVDQVWKLDGVIQVKGELGVDLAPTPAPAIVLVR
jgi:hypothetical protein